VRQKEGTKRRNKSGDREVIYRQKRLKNWLRRRHKRKNRGRESNRKRLKDEIDKYTEKTEGKRLRRVRRKIQGCKVQQKR
jgi:hypothetical protein